MRVYDFLVVGSGCSGAIAADAIIKDGRFSVGMLDVGNEPEKEYALSDQKDYISIRKNDPDQYKFELGEDGIGVSSSWGRVSKGAQLTPPRQYMIKDVEKLIPLISKGFYPLESLAYGGLGIGWGLQCWEFSDTELKKVGLNPFEIKNAYEAVSETIGISATDDEASRYTIGNLTKYQNSVSMDRNHSQMVDRYKKGISSFQNNGIYIGRTPLALLSEDLDSRKGYEYTDTDYYFNQGLSAWRPYITTNNLKEQPNFTYIGSRLVLSFKESKDFVTVTTLDIKSNKKIDYRCRKLILSASALGSARIVLRSLGGENVQLPLLSNPHSYIPCIQPSMMGKGLELKKLGLGQLSYFIDPQGTDDGLSVASSYSYQSLMLFRIINQFPLNYRDARTIARYLSSAFLILIVQHPDAKSASKYISLQSDNSSVTGDKLEACYELSNNEKKAWKEREKQYMKLMRKLGTYPIKRIETPHGSSIHYAGTLPFSRQKKDFSLSPEGRLHGTNNIYVADSSGFNFLPAKGLTFTLMANAHLTAIKALGSL